MSGRGFEKMFRTVGPFVAMAAMGGVMAAARKNPKFNFDWTGPDGAPGTGFGKGFGARGGVPLDALDMGGQTPAQLVLAGADTVVLVEGEDFTIAVQGDDEAKQALRFRLHDGALHVASDNSSNGGEGSGEGIATITVTMPRPSRLTIAGSGQITTAALADEAEVVIAGSGRIVARDIAVDQLDVSIAGSGKFKASGTVRQLDLSVAGSGSAKLGAVLVDKASVTIAGSGHAVFASDGAVKAHLMGSGTVTVRGAARCKVQSVGSGCLVCEPRPASGSDKAE